MRNADRVTAALLLAFALAFCGGALKFYPYWSPTGPGSGFMPFWLGVAMALLAGGMLVRSLRQREHGGDWLPTREGAWRIIVVLAVTTAFVALLKATGMIAGTAIFLFVLVRYLGRHPWRVCAGVAAAAAAFNYFVFTRWLRVPFPEGVLWIF